MGGIVGEIEFEFVDGAGGQGKFVPTGTVIGLLTKYLSRGELKEAAQIYQGCSPDVTAALLQEAQTGSAKLREALMEMFILARDHAAAARCAEMVDDPARAAQFFETAYEFGKAGELYRTAREFPKAALMFEKALRFAEAAQLYLQVGDLARAAENLERAGDALGAARLYLKTGEWKRAAGLLQAYPADRPDHAEAGILLSEILWRTGNRELAIARMAQVARAFPATPRMADLYYRLAEMLAEAGAPDRAALVLERLEEVKPGFKDVRDRITEMKRLSRVPEAPGGEAQGSGLGAKSEERRANGELPPPLDLGADVAEAAPAETVQVIDPDIEALREVPLLADLERTELVEVFRLAGRLTFPAGRIVLREGEAGRGLFVVRSGEVEVLKGLPERTAGGGRRPASRGQGTGNKEQGTGNKEQGTAGREEGAATGERLLARLGPGEHFGEMSIVDDAPVSATVRTSRDAVLLGIPKEDFLRFLYLHERAALKIYRFFARTLVRRLAEANLRAGR
jgi:CRP-like cAMP-binding protein/TolA-binding protein